MLIDLGLAKLLSKIEANSKIVGNFTYKAPEALPRENEGFGGPNSDIFSIAEIMIYCIHEREF